LPSRRVEDDLRRRYRAGEWEPGERLPAVAELAQHYGVARNTVIKALRRLADDGLVEIVPNWETFRRGNRPVDISIVSESGWSAARRRP
jgi:DNA-binding FadR family transcriptional regulator